MSPCQWTRWLPCPYMVKHFSRTKNFLCWILVYSIRDSKSTNFVQMIILGWPLTILRYGLICVQVAVAIREEVSWYLQVCNCCLYQVSKSWPIGLLFCSSDRMLWVFVCVVKFYGPGNPTGSCLFYWAGLVLQAFNQYYAHSFVRNWQLPILELAESRVWQKNVMVNICERMLLTWTRNLLITGWTHIQLSHRSTLNRLS